MSEDEGKYTLDYYTAEDPDPGGVPFKYRSHYLADVLADAWRIRDSGGRAVRISYEHSTVFDEEQLESALRRISELIPILSEHPLREIAERVIQEKGG